MEAAPIVALLVCALISGAVWLVTTQAGGQRAIIDRRLGAYALPGRRISLQTTLSVVRRKSYSRIRWLDAILLRLDVAEKLAGALRRAGVPMKAGEFLCVQAFLAAVSAAAALVALANQPGRVPAAGVAALAAVVLPLIWLKLKYAGRVSAFELKLADSIDLVVGSLRAGYGLPHGLDMISRETTGPCAEEFGQVLQELGLGADLEVALARMVERVGSEDARLLATAVAVQRRVGGNLADVLGAMAVIIRERLKLRGEVRVLTTAPRISGFVVALLPVLAAVAMYVTSRYYIELLVAHPLGRLALIASGVLTLIGVYINNRIAQVEL